MEPFQAIFKATIMIQSSAIQAAAKFKYPIYSDLTEQKSSFCVKSSFDIFDLNGFKNETDLTFICLVSGSSETESPRGHQTHNE